MLTAYLHHKKRILAQRIAKICTALHTQRVSRRNILNLMITSCGSSNCV